MSALTDILDWSTNRPLWQRDALRRIVTTGGLTEQDILELTTICLAQHGLDDPENRAPTARPLTEEQLTEPSATREPVRLLGLRDVIGVNALAAGQSMTFAPDGMTIIFGYNGSGKSGYARVLRALCRARHPGEKILPDAFREGDPPIPTAIVQYQVGEERREHQWKEGIGPPSEMKRMGFFDSDCAAVHIEGKNEIAYTPLGLDVLPKLPEVCQQVGKNIDEQIGDTQRAKPASLSNLVAFEGTEVGRQLERLHPESDIESLRELATLSDAERLRFEQLQELIGTDVAQRASELRRRLSHVGRLQQGVNEVTTGLSAESLGGIQRQLREAVTKRAAATAAAQHAFGEQPLSGVGEEVWQEMWAAARKYSEHSAYPSHEFPHVGEDSLCVLCQQPLGTDARQRLTTFEDFLRGDTERSATESASLLDGEVAGLQQLRNNLSRYRGVLPDAQIEDYELQRRISRFFTVARWTARRVTQSCTDRVWKELLPMPAPPANQLAEVEQELQSRIAELEQAANDEHRGGLLAEQRELDARRRLRDLLADAKTEIVRQQQLAALDWAKRDTRTTGITVWSVHLTDRYVTEALQLGMVEELGKLVATDLRVVLDSPGGLFGQKQFKISLRDASTDVAVGRVLSEGELRCVALAGFLAELCTEDSNSGIVFDDPVSSLDHRWRRKVAKRLVELATQRQVIVFTHDLAFVRDLEGAVQGKVSIHHVQVQRGPQQQPGQCIDGQLWESMRVKARIRALKLWQQNADALSRTQGEQAYAREASTLYGFLREAWERAVEEVLLYEVVSRNDAAIHPQRLKKVSDITDADVQAVEAAMDKCSRFLPGHDMAGSAAEPVPSPDELLQDIETLADWVKSLRPRRP